jgi:hypothetical protein
MASFDRPRQALGFQRSQFSGISDHADYSADTL